MSADPNNLKIVKEISRREILLSVARQPDSSRLFIGSSDAKVYELDLAAEKQEPREFPGHEGYVMGVVLAGEHLVSGAYDGRLIWWDREQRQPRRVVEAHTKWIRGVTITPDGAAVISVADDMVCRVWDAESGELRRELRGHAEKTPQHFPSMLYCAAVSPDGKLVATGDKLGKVLVWELATGNQIASLEAPIMYTWDPTQRIHSIGGIRSLAFSPDSRLLAVGGMGTVNNIDHLEGLARVEIFDWQRNERTHEFKGDSYKGLVEHLEFGPAGKWLLAVGGDQSGFLQFFDLDSGKVTKHDKAPMHVHDLVLDESGEMIYAVGHGKVVVWQMTA
jgi:WD40 repeat protein